MPAWRYPPCREGPRPSHTSSPAVSATSVLASSIPARPRSWSSSSAPSAAWESTDPCEAADSTDPNDAAEPIENADATEPTEPIENAEPTEPIEANDPREPIDRNEDSDHSDSPSTAEAYSARDMQPPPARYLGGR